MANGAAPSGNDPISAIANAVSNITGAILGFSNANRQRKFEAAIFNEEADVQAFGGKIARWFDQACEFDTTPEKIMFAETSIDGDQIRAAGSIQNWLSIRRERERAYAIYKAYYPDRNFWKDPCISFLNKDNIMVFGGILLLIIIIFLITKAI